jgi:hypothetical protein
MLFLPGSKLGLQQRDIVGWFNRWIYHPSYFLEEFTIVTG